MIAGFEAAHSRGETIANALNDIALLIGEGREGEPGLGLLDDARALATRAQDLTQGLFKILVIGEFKNGKSTLLNAMLGRKTLPAKAAPATAVITLLVAGDRPEVAIYETTQPTPRLLDWEAFVREFQLTRDDLETLEGTGTVDRFRDIAYAVIECRHPICSYGVTLIDSPGLGEHLSRTRVATAFLKQAQAVILVLNATRILTADERAFVEGTLGPGRLDHVFFVVNRINQVEDAEEIERWVERALAPHFQQNGAFDRDLYARRVFFVDARGALEARSGAEPDEASLAASGVRALEAELERFLTGEEKVSAALQSTVQFIGPVLAEAAARIAQERQALERPLAELEAKRAEAERRLEGMAGRRAHLERTILLFGETVREKVYADLRSFISEMEDRWPEEGQRLVPLDDIVSLRTLFQTYTEPNSRERMAAAIAAEVQRYLQTKFEEWSEGIPATVQPDLDALVAEVETQAGDIQEELDLIAGLFAGLPPRTTEGNASGARLIQLALTLEDIGDVTDTVTGVTDWKRLVGRWTQNAIVMMFVRTFITGSALMALLLVEGLQLGVGESEVKRRIRELLGKRLFPALREQMTERQPIIRQAIDEHFRGLAGGLSSVIGNQIEELRREQERIIARRQDEQFSADQAIARLDALSARLSELTAMIADAAGRALATSG
jgi:hypothetical protein